MITPSPEQQAILDLGLDTIKIRAGAGTGKTTTVALVIANLVNQHGLDPEQVLGITFTNKAASELAERIRTTIDLPESGHQVEVHTYHGFAAQVLSEFGPLAGVDNRVRVITPTFARQLLSETIHNTRFENLDITNRKILGSIAGLSDRLGDHLLTPADLLGLPIRDDIEAKRGEMATVLEQYEKDKRELGVVDFSDLVTLAARIVTTHPEMARTVRDRYRIVVLDEYQDTNPGQRALLSAIFSDGFPVIAVGDEDQTIYEWRGASAENFEMFASHFPRPDGSPAHLRGLTLNRRSIQPILDIANRVRAQVGDDPDDLVSHRPGDNDGEIVTYWGGSTLDEAEWIASTFEQLHEQGHPWKEMAVLFRKNKDFAMVIDAFSRHEIPVEVASVGGLLAVPEVADLRAWLTVLEHPADSTAIANILLGSRYRLGLADLGPITARLRERSRERPDQDDRTPITLIEAIEEGTEPLRPEAEAALAHFRRLYERLVVDTQGLSLVEVCRLVLDVTGAWQDTEALPPNQRLTARLNLYRMLDLAEDWSPLRGKPSLHALLEYLDDMENESGEDLDAASISGEDAVTFVTVHRAKGLEWDTVAIPAVTAGNFPSASRGYPNPLTAPEYVPAQLRLDRVFDGVPVNEVAYKNHLRMTHSRQEWRTAYVAVTRARRRLYVSGAYWYGHPEPLKQPKKPSELWTMVDQSPGVRSALPGPVPPRPDILRVDDSEGAPDPVFAGGWETALRGAIVDPETMTELARQTGVGDDYQELVDDMESRLFTLAEPVAPDPLEDDAAVSVTGLVTYAQCPKRFFWSNVDPLPRRANPAATRGTEIHRQIELHQRGHIPLDLVDHDLYDSVEPVGSGPPAFDTYMTSRFAESRATLVETPFRFELVNGYQVRGRIDAVYVDGDRWEVVDFKSGRIKSDQSNIVQLQAYAIAVTDLDFGIPPPQEVVVTFAYLGGGGGEITHAADDTWMAAARESLESHTTSMSQGRFEENPGDWCGGCDFLRFCGPGRKQVGK